MQKQPETLGEIIKVAREKSDLTVEELTTRSGISERYLYRIENEGKVPKFEVLKKLVRELAIDANSIFYPEKPSKDSEVEDLVRTLYSCDDRSMKIVTATAKAALDIQFFFSSAPHFTQKVLPGFTAAPHFVQKAPACVAIG